MTSSRISGLDMCETIRWYFQNRRRCMNQLPEPFIMGVPYEIDEPENISLTMPQITGAVLSFPDSAIQRSILKRIIGQPETWFHKK